MKIKIENLDCQYILKTSLAYSMKGYWKRFLIIWMSCTLAVMIILSFFGYLINENLMVVIALFVGFVFSYLFQKMIKNQMKMEIAEFARFILPLQRISNEEMLSWEKRIGKKAAEYLEEKKIFLHESEIEYFLTGEYL